MSFVKHISLQLAGEETRENLFIREIKTDDIIPNTNFIKLIYIYIYISLLVEFVFQRNSKNILYKIYIYIKIKKIKFCKDVA